MLKQNVRPQSGHVHQENLFKFDPRLKGYPSSLNFYQDPPQHDLTLLEFERFALDRLTVLLAIDSGRVRAKTDSDLVKLTEPVILKHMELGRNTAVNGKSGASSLYDQRVKDHTSHFILRLAYCKSHDLQAWFIKQEVSLFRLRYLSASAEERDILVKASNISFSQCTLDDLLSIISKKSDGDRNMLMETIKAVYGDLPHQHFYKVPWEKVGELVSKRQVLIYEGLAYVPESERLALILHVYRAHLKVQLGLTARALPRLDEDDRLMPVLHSLAKQSLSKEYSSVANGNEIRAEDVVKVQPHFPPCMNALQSGLTRDSHLKHNGRIQYGLFLKGIGLSMEEALIFWRRSFGKMTDDEFNKKGYPYNIRYNYGMEGKRTDYTPYSCLKMIQSLPGPGETHGCPFKHYSTDALTKMMDALNVTQPNINTVVQKSKDGHYQLACTRLYEVTKGKVHAAAQDRMERFGSDAEGNFLLLEPIDHPNRWFDLSLSGERAGKMEVDK